MKVRFWFRKCQTNPKNQVGTLYVYVTLNGIRSREFSTGISVEKKQWDAKNQKVKGNSILTQEIENLKNTILKAKQKLEFEKSDFTANDVLELVFNSRNKQLQPTFLQIWQQFFEVKQKQEKWSYNTIRNHKTMLKTFSRFLQEKQLENILPQNLKKLHLQEFIIWYNRSKNVTARVIAMVQRVLQYCIDCEIIHESPLLHYSIERENRIDKTHLTETELEKLENYHTENLSHVRAKDIFLFLCYTGLNVSDYFRFAQNPQGYIKESFIIMSRQKMEKKSSQKAYIPITEKTQAILEKYKYQLPTFKNPQTINKILKELGQILRIEAKKMRTKVGRKTFAHFWLNSNIDRKAVSKMLGHAKTTTLEQYYADVDFEFVKSQILKNAPEI